MTLQHFLEIHTPLFLYLIRGNCQAYSNFYFKTLWEFSLDCLSFGYIFRQKCQVQQSKQECEHSIVFLLFQV
jgi:hypothetical protein